MLQAGPVQITKRRRSNMALEKALQLPVRDRGGLGKVRKRVRILEIPFNPVDRLNQLRVARSKFCRG